MAINDDQLSVKCSSTDKDRWRDAAQKEGRTLSNWVIWYLNQQADKQLAEDEKK